MKLVDILTGKGTLPVTLDRGNYDAEKSETLLKYLSEILSGVRPIKVDLAQNKTAE
jgi:hypothetical protein